MGNCPSIHCMENETLISEIERYCAKHNIAETTFGRRAVNDGKLVSRLRAGKTITMATYLAVQAALGSQAQQEAS